MQAFPELYQQLDASTRTSEKTAALRRYFQAAPAADAAWAVFFLTGQRLAAPVKTSLLRLWVAELTGWPLWLVEASYERVGDLAETVALLLKRPLASHPNHEPAPAFTEGTGAATEIRGSIALTRKAFHQNLTLVS